MPDLLGDFSFTWPFYLGAVLAYLLGSIPFGVVLTRLAGLGDIRRIGSGNIGATNVLRTGSKKLAAATLVLDLAKGAAAVLFAKTYGPDMAVFAAMGVVLGHCFPVWLKWPWRHSPPPSVFGRTSAKWNSPGMRRLRYSKHGR